MLNHSSPSYSDPTPPPTKSKRGWRILLTLILLLGASGATATGAWLGFQLMFDPDAVLWLNRFLPHWTQIPIAHQESLQTLLEVQTQIRQAGLIAGEPLALAPASSKSPPAKTDLLLPVLSRRLPCTLLPTRRSEGQAGCESVVELRVYQPVPSPAYSSSQEQYFRLVSQAPITGPDESFVAAPLNLAPSSRPESNRVLPLTLIQQFEQAPAGTGIWLLLSGQWQQGETPITYGQVLHYNPSQSHLGVMLDWSSPAGQMPYWKNVTGDSASELVVNQTVRLEPQFQVYQLKPRQFTPNPIQLEPVSLAAPGIETRTYQQILSLARSGLWSPAWQWLRSLKQETNPWPEPAQAQMDVIRLHAQITQAQADKNWASPSQAVLTQLMDGRWAAALEVFEASADNRREILRLLQTESADRLWTRAIAALEINPARLDVKIWGALMMAAQKNRTDAIAWLKQQPKTTPADMARIESLLDQWDATTPGRERKTTTNAATHPSQILGAATPLSTLNRAQWLLPTANAPLQLESEQTWYQIEVAGFQDGQRWQRSPFSELTQKKLLPLSQPQQVQALWNLMGLNSDPQVQIIVDNAEEQQVAVTATVQAMQAKGGSIQLLAAGPKLSNSAQKPNPSPRSLTLTATPPKWIEPETKTLGDVYAQQPAWVTQVLPQLWQELQKNAQLPVQSMPGTETVLRQWQLESWLVQLVDLTGNQKPELLLTLDANALAHLQENLSGQSTAPLPRLTQPRTLIFSDAGQLIYSEFSQAEPQTLTAIADLEAGASPVLVVGTAQTYRLQRWSPQKRQFE